jgi:ABC-type glycerol-3-phosphate transport system permease component
VIFKKRIKKLNAFKFVDGSRVLIATLYALISIVPIIYIVNHAFKPLSELFLYPPRFFVNHPTLRNFFDFVFALKLSTVPFSRYLFNSFFVTGMTIFLSVAIGSMGAYALSKMKFPGKNIIFSTIVIALMFSPEAVKLTRYLIITRLGIMNTYFGHILPMLAMPVSIFLIKQFMDQIPGTLNEAARIDGASEWRTFISIILPNVKPAIGTAAILAFQAVWGDLETSTYYMTNETMKTLPYFVQTLNGGLTVTGSTTPVVARQGAAAAAGLLLFLPNFIIFIILQKSMMSTLVNSGIK